MKLFTRLLAPFLALGAGTAPVWGQQAPASRLFADYQQDKTRSVLPDFSYAGYHYGEKALPRVKGYPVFDVTDFGALPDDSLSDREAIQAAIRAANERGSGIVFFPKGRFLVNEDSAATGGILSKGGNIVFRGSGSGPGGTELFMRHALLPAHPKNMWTGPPMFTFTANGSDQRIGEVTRPAAVGAFEIALGATEKLQEGDWVALKLLDNAPALLQEELAPHRADTSWSYLVKKGVDVCMYYQVVQVGKGRIRLHAPLAYPVDPRYRWSVYKFAQAGEVGIEDIAFVGNWKESFVHHRSWKDDSGFNLLSLSRCTHSWMRNCRFTDCTNAAVVGQSANVTVLDCRITGNAGHQAIMSNHSTNVLLARLTDEASQWHSFGASHGAVNTVLWRCTYPATTCFESHASQPRNTLLDNVTGGLMRNRGGGAIENMPNHMKGLVFWNYTQTNAPVKDFQFWPAEDVWWKIPQPVIAGFRGNGTSFRREQLGALEGLDSLVAPLSLYEAQLELRLKQRFSWLAQKP
ncbi:DUF4955 domain-containing protein [Paraflavisolibacter sp. H34]|uniref:DUF4955 domain-containing protein n=1 Tax=Huijunlia imazamoxiresistens TaxID=3127457 RepID=UPI003016B723